MSIRDRGMDRDEIIDGGEVEVAAANLAERRRGGRKKICKFCAEKVTEVDYKDTNVLRYYLTERGKVVPRRISGNCAYHQRMVNEAIKRGRMIALLPFTVAQ
ncbi:MAG: 30S ribosomal protein S18 [Deltaproteobacteria bacterium]|nr:30S ribosomal protein S18 [Deltaproteobacteria bacterium]